MIKISGKPQEYILLTTEVPYEGIDISDCILFKSKEDVEKFVEEHPLDERYKYVARYLPLS